MSGFDRSKFKTTSLNTLKDQEKEQNEKRNFKNFDGLSFLHLDDGENLIRIYPHHPDGKGESFAEPKTVTFLEVSVPKKDKEGNKIEGEFELKNKPIFNAKVHGNYEKDLVEEYMSFAKEVVIPELYLDEEDQKKAWSKVVGYKSGGKYIPGIKPMDTWCMYVSKYGGKTSGFGILEVKKSVVNGLREEAAKLIGADDTVMPDPYTDPDLGVRSIITYNPKADKPEDYYKVQLEMQRDGLNFSLVPTPLSDEELEHFLQQDSLYKRYRNSFKRSDFEYQLEGLKRFDEKIGLGIFAYDSWLDICEEISEMIPEDQPENPAEDETRVRNAAPTDKLPWDLNKEEEKRGIDFHKELQEKRAEEEAKKAVTLPKKQSQSSVDKNKTIQDRLAKLKAKSS